MNLRGPCTSCGSALAVDQRYCVECGQRVGPPLAMPYPLATPAEAAAVAAGSGGLLASLPMPIQTATTLAALALGFGVVAGTAISPNLAGTVAGPLVVQAAAPPPEPEPAAATSGGGAAPPPAEPPTGGPFFTETPTTTTTTPPSGGEDTKEPKEEPLTLSGTVVHQNPVAGSYTITPGGGVTVLHTTKALPALGSKVEVPVRELSNLTSAEDGKRKVTGQATTAAFSGVVTFSDNSVDPGVRDAYTLSNRGSSILVYGQADPSAADAALRLKPPGVGAVVRITVEIKDRIQETPDPLLPPAPPPPARPNCPLPVTPVPTPPVSVPKALYETAPAVIEAKPSEVDSAELATVVESVCENQVLGAADDIRESGADLFSNPTTGDWLSPATGVSVTGFTPGQAVLMNLKVVDDTDADPDTRVLGPITGIRNDAGIQGADDSSSAQGDLRVARSTRKQLLRASRRSVAGR